MKIIKKWWIFVLTLLVSFGINFNWFRFREKNICDTTNCADYLGSPDFSVYPNFTFEKVCGGISGQCVPTHLEIFITDLLISIVLFFVILFIIFIIKRITKKSQINTLNE